MKIFILTNLSLYFFLSYTLSATQCSDYNYCYACRSRFYFLHGAWSWRQSWGHICVKEWDSCTIAQWGIDSQGATCFWGDPHPHPKWSLPKDRKLSFFASFYQPWQHGLFKLMFASNRHHTQMYNEYYWNAHLRAYGRCILNAAICDIDRTQG